jgi:hypothetical protein
MFYEALVIDNSEFFTKGTIQVRASFFFMFPMNWDLSTDLQDVELGKTKDDKGKVHHLDFDAHVLAPLGGGDGYGTLFLPQINERGFIVFPENNLQNNPVWIGSYFKAFLDKNQQVSSTNIPSNITDKDGIDSVNEHTVNYNQEQKTNILMRTKNTEYDKEDASKLRWVERPTTNIVSISNEGIKINHYNQENGWKDNTANNYSSVNITDDKVFVQNVNNDKGNTFDITLTDESLEVDKNGKTKITIDKDGNITVDTPKKIYFKNADKIEFLGHSRHLIGYEELYDALDTYLCNHIHITPNGPSDGPLDSSMAPLRAVMMNDMIQMKEKNLLTE